MTSRVPRKQRNLKAAAEAAENANVELNSSNCSEGDTLEAVNSYEFFGFGNAQQSFQQGEQVDIASIEFRKKQIVGRTDKDAIKNLMDVNDLIVRSQNAGLDTGQARTYYFSEAQTTNVARSGGVTGSSTMAVVYGKNGPQAPYIPHLVHQQDGLSTGAQYVFFLPSSVTGAAGINMPLNHSRSLEITIAGALGKGEKVQVYTASLAGVREATGSAFSFDGTWCSTPNYSQQTMRILTSSLASGNPSTSQAGIVIMYTASYTEDGVVENTPYAGVTVTINPSSLVT